LEAAFVAPKRCFMHAFIIHNSRFIILLLLLSRPLLAEEAQPIAEFKARVGTITASAISADGKFLFTGEDYGQVTLWNIASGTSAGTYMGHTRSVLAAALLPDGKRGITCGDDNLVIVWDLATGKRLHEMHTGDSIPWVMSCSGDRGLAATGCNDGQIMVWEPATGRLVTTLSHPAGTCSLSFSPDSKVLAAGYSDGQVILWATSDWSQKHILPSADGANVGALAFSTDSRLLATGNQNGAGFVWKIADGRPVSHFAGYDNPETVPTAPVAPVFPGSTITPENRGSIVFLCFNPDASVLFASTQDNIPRFWDAKAGRLLGIADWYSYKDIDSRFYIPRFGFTFATAAVTPKRDLIVTLRKNGDQDDFVAQVWRMSFTPSPPKQ